MAAENERKKTMERKSCSEKIAGEYRDTMRSLRTLWELYCKDPEAYTEDGNRLTEYGLAFDYVAPGTFGEEQAEGYFRYQLSWGGPSDEFRFYVNPDYSVHAVEYWYMDWFDGAHRRLEGEDLNFIVEFYDGYLRGSGVCETAYEDAMAGR